MTDAFVYVLCSCFVCLLVAAANLYKNLRLWSIQWCNTETKSCAG